MSVQTQIDRINGEVTSQANVMSQIKTALAGKAAGTGGFIFEKVASDFQCVRTESTLDIRSYDWWDSVALENIYCVITNILCTTTGTFSANATCSPVIKYADGIITLNRTQFSGNLAVTLVMDVYIAMQL